MKICSVHVENYFFDYFFLILMKISLEVSINGDSYDLLVISNRKNELEYRSRLCKILVLEKKNGITDISTLINGQYFFCSVDFLKYRTHSNLKPYRVQLCFFFYQYSTRLNRVVFLNSSRKRNYTFGTNGHLRASTFLHYYFSFLIFTVGLLLGLWTLHILRPFSDTRESLSKRKLYIFSNVPYAVMYEFHF